MFKLSTQVRAYIAHPVIDGSRRIRSGFLELSTYATRRLAETFDEAWDLASPPADVFAAFAATRSSTSDEPGTLMQAHFLADPVISCEEAARARGIPLANELKTLILHTTVGPVAAHLPGDGILSLRKVKDRLESAEAYLADPEDLLAMDLSPGTVCAVLDPVWSMPHLVSRRVVDLSEVATNNGTRSGYFLFSPEVLTTARNVIIGDFEK
jgi:prolyl-tRNA editing enzyme YbaK/EbsC (Cys-tRNA(Pro) deacylase)